MEKGMTELRVDHLEIMARTWAADKAREIAGTVVDHALNHTQATVPALEHVEAGKRFMERFLTAWLKNCTVEFVRVYERALEERTEQLERMLNERLNTSPAPPVITKP